jgi:hypothetical protein
LAKPTNGVTLSDAVGKDARANSSDDYSCPGYFFIVFLLYENIA